MEHHSILLAALAGLACALIFSSIPVGPVNLTILNEGAGRGFRWAFMIGLGAATMDCIYCAISFTGFSSFFDIPRVRAFMQMGSFLFLLYLGYKIYTAPTVKVPTKLDHASEKIEARLEQKLHPHSAFMTGFVRVMGNLGVLLTWIVLTANLMSHEWVANKLGAKIACVTGVAIGTVIWFFILSYGVSRSQGRMSEKTLLQLQHISGICLIVVGIIDGLRIIWHLRA